MANKKLTAEEFLLDTLRYYSKSPEARRCKNASGCYYNPSLIGKQDTSQGCAVGRLMTQQQKAVADSDGPTGYASLPFRVRPASIRHLSEEFIMEVQSFHDFNAYWGKKGLSNSGRSRLDNLLNKYALPKRPFRHFLRLR